MGTTTVTCMAVDASGNTATATCSFSVTVQPGQGPGPIICIQDDTTGALLLLNPETGEYTFCCADGFTLSGIGRVTIRGSYIFFEHTPTDRCVLAKIDLITGQAVAALHAPMGTVRCTIRDTDITNNTCVCPNGPVGP